MLGIRISLLAAATLFLRCGTNPVAPVDDLAGPWLLESFGPAGQEAPLIQDTRITAELGPDRRISGFGGCNSYGATFRRLGSNGLRISRIESTRIRCAAPPGVSDQEAAYFAALRQVDRFEPSAGVLVLLYESGAGRLLFRRQE